MNNKESNLKNLRFDFSSALVVFFVALPLCLGVSLASTSYKDITDLNDFAGTAFPGLISGIIGGIIVGFFSGSRFGVSGPAAGLITIIAAAIVTFGGFENGFGKFLVAVILAGILQVIFGFLKAGFLAYYFPSAVIKGMLAGIGVTIFTKELPHFFGYDADPEGEMSFLQPDGHNTLSELLYMLDGIHWGAFLVGTISLIVLIIWGSKFIKQNKILSLVPGPLLAIIISIGVAALIYSIPEFTITKTHLVNVPVTKSTEDLTNLLHFPDFSALTDYNVYIIAITIALVASLETLLCVEATDKLDPQKGRTPLNQELKAQGIGNIVAGFIGGLPITQVIVRSSANIDAGAKSKNSTIIHGVLLLVCIFAIPGLLNMIPRASLAAVLLLIGYKLANPKQIKEMYKKGWDQLIPFVLVVIAIFFTDLLIGIAVGLAIAFFVILYKNYKMDYFIGSKNQMEDGKMYLALSQHATFLNKASISKTLDEVPNNTEVTIDLSKTLDVDYDILETIEEFKAQAKDKNISVIILEKEKN